MFAGVYIHKNALPLALLYLRPVHTMQVFSYSIPLDIFSENTTSQSGDIDSGLPDVTNVLRVINPI